MTNKEKFKEVFGFTPRATNDCCPKELNCTNMTCKDCTFNRHWWDKEYRPCFEIKEKPDE